MNRFIVFFEDLLWSADLWPSIDSRGWIYCIFSGVCFRSDFFSQKIWDDPTFLMSMFNSFPSHKLTAKALIIGHFKRTCHLPSINFQVLWLLVSEEGSISEVLLVHENQPFFFSQTEISLTFLPGRITGSFFSGRSFGYLSPPPPTDPPTLQDQHRLRRVKVQCLWWAHGFAPVSRLNDTKRTGPGPVGWLFVEIWKISHQPRDEPNSCKQWDTLRLPTTGTWIDGAGERENGIHYLY